MFLKFSLKEDILKNVDNKWNVYMNTYLHIFAFLIVKVSGYQFPRLFTILCVQQKYRNSSRF